MGRMKYRVLKQGQYKLRLHELRVERGLTQLQLSKMCGTTIASISLYERGNFEPSLEMLVKLTVALNLTGMDQLVTIDFPAVAAALDGTAPSVARPAAQIVNVEIPPETTPTGPAGDPEPVPSGDSNSRQTPAPATAAEEPKETA